jgi:hypothetical protein
MNFKIAHVVKGFQPLGLLLGRPMGQVSTRVGMGIFKTRFQSISLLWLLKSVCFDQLKIL